MDVIEHKKRTVASLICEKDYQVQLLMREEDGVEYVEKIDFDF